MAEMKTLNGYEIVDAKARQRIQELEGSGTSGGTTDSLTTVVKSLAELKSAISNGNRNIALGASFEVGERLIIPTGCCLNGCGYTITRATGYEGILLRANPDCRIQDLIIDGNRGNMVSPNWENTNEINGNSRLILDRVTIINGNEAITTHGDDVIIRNCKITNCGGNGIHFTGGHRTRVENCTIIGTNLNSSMGNAGGCIKWCDVCRDIVVTGCWLENGRSAFGNILTVTDSNIQLIGNTAKDCRDSAADIVFSSSGIPKNIIIDANMFRDCAVFKAWSEDAQLPASIPLIISNNIFENTPIHLDRVSDTILSGNTIKGKSYIKGTWIPRTIISNNIIDDTSDEQIAAVDVTQAHNLKLVDNYIRAKYRGFSIGIGCADAVVSGNTIRQNYSSAYLAGKFLNLGANGARFENNSVASYKSPLWFEMYGNIVGNKFYVSDTSTYGIDINESKAAGSGTIFKENRTNGATWIEGGSGKNLIENNDIPLEDDVFKTLRTSLISLTSDVPSKVIVGDSFECVLVAADGCSLPKSVTIINNGKTSREGLHHEYDSTTGKLVINCVMGAVVILASTGDTAAIIFTIDGEPYIAKEGTKWELWCGTNEGISLGLHGTDTVLYDNKGNWLRDANGAVVGEKAISDGGKYYLLTEP